MSVEGLEALKSFSLEHIQRDIGHTHTHTHTDATRVPAGTHCQVGVRGGGAGSRHPFPAFPVSACRGHWRDADPASDGRRDRLKPRGQTGYLDACERWGVPGSPPPWPVRTCPPGRRGGAWLEMGRNRKGHTRITPSFGRGDLVH